MMFHPHDPLLSPKCTPICTDPLPSSSLLDTRCTKKYLPLSILVYKLYLLAEDKPSLSSCVVREYTPVDLSLSVPFKGLSWRSDQTLLPCSIVSTCLTRPQTFALSPHHQTTGFCH